MARVTFINAILSGKLAGTVYARNKAGHYLKSYSKPLNPDTEAQQANRALFGASSGQWHTLTDAQKALWNSYGSTIFVSKTGLAGSPVSGFNAFISLRNEVEAAIRGTRVATVSAPVGVTVAAGTYTPIWSPPAIAMGSAIQDSTGAPISIMLANATFNGATYAVTATFALGGLLTSVPVFEDAVTDTPVGIMLQMSIPHTQKANYVTGKNNQIIGVVAPPTLTAATWTGGVITFSMSGADSHMDEYKTGVQTGQIVEIQAYLVSEKGESRSIGSRKITVA